MLSPAAVAHNIVEAGSRPLASARRSVRGLRASICRHRRRSSSQHGKGYPAELRRRWNPVRGKDGADISKGQCEERMLDANLAQEKRDGSHFISAV